jgi:hypothetical protein
LLFILLINQPDFPDIQQFSVSGRIFSVSGINGTPYREILFKKFGEIVQPIAGWMVPDTKISGLKLNIAGYPIIGNYR